MLEVAEVVSGRSEGPLVVCVALPKNKYIVSISKRDTVPGVVVNLPANTRGVEQIENDWVIENPVAPEAVCCDSARGSCRKIEAVRPRRAEQRTKIVRTKRELVEKTVIKG